MYVTFNEINQFVRELYGHQQLVAGCKTKIADVMFNSWGYMQSCAIMDALRYNKVSGRKWLGEATQPQCLIFIGYPLSAGTAPGCSVSFFFFSLSPPVVIISML